MDTSGLENVIFGASIREKEFLIREKSVHLNHGSYGTVPRRVFDLRMKYCLELESHPDNWFRNNLRTYWQTGKEAICKFVKVKDTDCVVFIENTTTGINTILKSLNYVKGEVILGTNITYQAVKNTTRYINDSIEGAEARYLDIMLPITSTDQVIQLYKDYFKNNTNVKIAVIDYITSPSSILMPVKEIIDVCHSHGVLTIIDGAHTPGQIELNLDELGADFFVGNLHKWLFVPRGCAIIYAAKEHIDKIHSLTTSWQLYKGFDAEFRDNGTKDHTPFVCSTAGLEFFQSIGGLTKISEYNRKLVREGRDYLINLWGAEKQEIPEEMESPFLLNVKLPPLKGYEVSEESAAKFQYDLFSKHDVMVKIMSYQGNNYCRISSQVYNTMDDFKRLGEVTESYILK